MSPVSKLYLWENRTLYIGTIAHAIRFVQPASSVTFSLGKPIVLTLDASSDEDSKRIEALSFLLPPGQDVRGEFGDSPVAICMLDPLGCDYTSMASQMQNTCRQLRFGVTDEAHCIEALKSLYYEECTAETAYQCIDSILSRSDVNEHKVDSRIVTALELIQRDVQDNVPTEYFAKEIGISYPRLVQLFREQVGAPIRRYRLWHRLFCATREIARTQNISAGAHAAGFSDTAHFNRTFRRMLGMTPTDLLSQPNGLKIYAPLP
jgi:AraC-like DNA-binding protein